MKELTQRREGAKTQGKKNLTTENAEDTEKRGARYIVPLREMEVVMASVIQRERLRERSGLTPEQIESRIASQMPFEEKVKVADFVIDNSGDIGKTRQRVEEVYRQLRAIA